MDAISTKKLVDGYHKAFIDSSCESDPTYSPSFLSNSRGQKVLTAIEKELEGCDDFFISVAFITKGGVALLSGPLEELAKQGIKGRIITTDYLMFSEPGALDQLASLNNLDLRIFKTADNKVGFHTKGYMFHNGDNLRIIIGSSNLTQDAITRNYEWNTRLVSSVDGSYAKDVETEFEDLWDSSVCYSEYRDEYAQLYENSRKEREKISQLTRTLDLSYSQVLQPNQMQSLFSLRIEEILRSGGKRAMLISATGTGKTYASAFAIRRLLNEKIIHGKKVLFLSHREQINRQALNSYQRIFGKPVEMALLSGTYNDIKAARQAQFLFSTMNMMAKQAVHEQFAPQEYAVIVLDECHRSGAESYQKIIKYFHPELLLGMSASPERTDDFDVFSLSLAGEGDLRQKVANLAKKLQTEGLMDPARKRPLPSFPEAIGLVTSPRGAAVHDVLRTMRRRYPSARILLAGVPVEGADAPKHLSQALQTVAESGAELVLLVRGGGSFEDLMPFNDEGLARTIAALPIPVVTGIGHEPDNSIADMVADLRASTPTAAAEAVTPNSVELSAALAASMAHINRTLQTRLQQSYSKLETLATRPVLSDPQQLVTQQALALDVAFDRLQRAIPSNLLRDANQLQQSSIRLKTFGKNMIEPFAGRLATQAARLEDLSPLSILGRGYALAKDKEGKLVASVQSVSEGDAIALSVSDGVINCTVDSCTYTDRELVSWKDDS